MPRNKASATSSTLGRDDNTPSKLSNCWDSEYDAIPQGAASGLLSAMKRKSKNSALRHQPSTSFRAARDLDPCNYTPASQLSVPGSNKDNVTEENGESDSSDPNSLFISSKARRRSGNVGSTSKSQAVAIGRLSTVAASTGNTGTIFAGSKRKREEEPTEPGKEIARYHDEANRRNISPKFLFPGERQSLGVLTQKSWLQKRKPTMQISGLQHGSPSRTFSFVSPLFNVNNDDMSVTDRKRFFIYTPTDAMKEAMQTHVSNIHRLFPPTRGISDCMLHPNPGGLLKNGKYNQVIACNYQWRDATGIHAIGVNFGIVALIVNSYLTAAQKVGFIEDAWHLSHLCGNWICCNWRHHTVEPGPINIGRNACFNSSEPCQHDPPCMKDKKITLNLPASPATPGAVQAVTELSMDLEAEEAQRKFEEAQKKLEEASEEESIISEYSDEESLEEN